MIDQFTNSALIIDDKVAEITKLQSSLESKDIWVKHFDLQRIQALQSTLKNRKIIFLDLSLDDSKNMTENISLIRSSFKKSIGKDFGTYGLVLWTKHDDDINTFKTKIAEDYDAYTLPLFIVKLDKNKYLREGSFDTIFGDIDLELTNNVAANVFTNWNSLIDKGKDNAITNVFSLVKDFSLQDKNLKFILFELAKNYAGIPASGIPGYPLHNDAFRAFVDMLHFETLNTAPKNFDIFQNPDSIVFSGSPKEKNNIICALNSRLLIDTDIVDQQFVIPGNVYEIMHMDSPLLVENLPTGSYPIVIEITPPCDFANNKKAQRSRAIGGFLCDYDKAQLDKHYRADCYYREIYPLKIDGKSKPQMIIFDFRYFSSLPENDFKKPELYKILFRAKDRLFADILQKLSSHIARLGLSVIH